MCATVRHTDAVKFGGVAGRAERMTDGVGDGNEKKPRLPGAVAVVMVKTAAGTRETCSTGATEYPGL